MVDNHHHHEVDEELQDRLLPIANVGRIMKQSLPERGRVSKEAKQRIQECATEFLSFVTSEASDRCHQENRKTMNGDDICWALTSLGFDNYARATTLYLAKFREAERVRLAANNQSGVSVNDTNIREDHHHELGLNLEFRILEEKGDDSIAKPY